MDSRIHFQLHTGQLNCDCHKEKKVPATRKEIDFSKGGYLSEYFRAEYVHNKLKRYDIKRTPSERIAEHFGLKTPLIVREVSFDCVKCDLISDPCEINVIYGWSELVAVIGDGTGRVAKPIGLDYAHPNYDSIILSAILVAQFPVKCYDVYECHLATKLGMKIGYVRSYKRAKLAIIYQDMISALKGAKAPCVSQRERLFHVYDKFKEDLRLSRDLRGIT